MSLGTGRAGRLGTKRGGRCGARRTHLKARGGGHDLVRATRRPAHRRVVDHRRLADEARAAGREGAAARVQEAGAARSAEPLAAGGGEEVAAERLDVERQDARRLARVEHVERVAAGGAARRTDALGRLHHARLGLHVRERDERGGAGRRGGERALQSLHVGDAVGAHRQHLELRAGALGHLQHRHRVARVLTLPREDAVVRPEGERVEGARPSGLRALGERDLVGRAIQQRRDGGVRLALDARRRRVAADRPLEVEVARHGVVDECW